MPPPGVLVPGGWRGLVRVDRWLLAGGSWGLAVPFPELALEVGHVELIGELVQVRERRSGRPKVALVFFRNKIRSNST